jgi:protoporphyrinogen oxidase
MKKILIIIPWIIALCLVLHFNAGAEIPAGANSSSYQVVIVGAGFAGLTAAYFLQDYDILVLEKEDRVGGRVYSGLYEGVHYAKGAEYMGAPYGALKRMVEELNLIPIEIPAPMDGKYYQGQFYYGEDEIEEMFVAHSSRQEYRNFVAEILNLYDKYEEIPLFDFNSSLAPLDLKTADQWFSEKGWSNIYRHYYNVSSRGLFGAAMSEISMLGFLPEIAFDYEEEEGLTGNQTNIDGLTGATPRAAGVTDSYTFNGGIAEVTNAIADVLGRRVQLNSTVTAVTREGSGYAVRYNDGGGTPMTVRAEVVILAVPAPVAIQIGDGVLSAEQRSIMEQIPYSVYITLALFSRTPIFDKAFDLAVPDGYFFTDLYDSTWIRDNGSNTPQSLYINSVYIAPAFYTDTSLYSMPEAEVLSRTYTDLEKLFPGAQAKVFDYDLHRFQYAYPVMTLDTYSRLTRLHRITHGSLLLAGDYMIYPTFEAAVDSGYLAALKARRKLSTPPSGGGDYNGDGTSDIAIFRGGSGLWAIRGVSRFYFGGDGDYPVSGDYNGDGRVEAGIFRFSSGLWAIRGVNRTYFGNPFYLTVPADYDGDGCCDRAVFRPDSGLWAVQGTTRIYFGSSNDRPVPGDYNGAGGDQVGVFRGRSGLWAIRGFTRLYFGCSNDTPVPGSFSLNPGIRPAIFRPASGLWAIRGATRTYFGAASDLPVPGNYTGNGIDKIGIFRGYSGLWALHGTSRIYFGGEGDRPVTR